MVPGIVIQRLCIHRRLLRECLGKHANERINVVRLGPIVQIRMKAHAVLINIVAGTNQHRLCRPHDRYRTQLGIRFRDPKFNWNSIYGTGKLRRDCTI
jgi:hypothetical protein